MRTSGATGQVGCLVPNYPADSLPNERLPQNTINLDLDGHEG